MAIAINALDASAGRNYIRKQLTPMADPTSNIENILHAIEREPFAHQLKKIEIPPRENRDSTKNRAYRRNTRPNENSECEIRWPSRLPLATAQLAGRRAGLYPGSPSLRSGKHAD